MFSKIFPGPLIIDYGPSDIQEEEVYLFTELNGKNFYRRNGADNSTKYLDVWALENLAITASHWNSGFGTKFIETPISFYLISYLNASSSQMAALKGLCDLPPTLKFLYGMLSDGNTFLGYRRKPWLFIGWISFVMINYCLYTEGEPGLELTIMMMFIARSCVQMSEVVHDTLCAERGNLESNSTRGFFMTTTHTVKAFGCVIGAILGALLFNKPIWGWGISISKVFLIQASLPLFTILACWHMIEISSGYQTPSFRFQVLSMWSTLKLRAVWQPMIFVFTYNFLQVPNVAFKNFLVKGLGFENFELGLLLVGATVFGWLGLIIYREYFFGFSWRDIYIWTTIIGFVCSLMQIVLAYRWNQDLGIPDLYFAIGDEATAVLVEKVHSMPTRIMYITLISERRIGEINVGGCEGAIFSLLISITSIGYVFGSAFGGILSEICNINNESLSAGDFSGVAKLTIALAFIRILPLSLVYLLPDTREEQRALFSHGGSSVMGGGVLIITLLTGVILAVLCDFYFIYQ